MSEAEGTVRYERRGRTARITFHRPAARNALSEAMYAQLDSSLERVAAEADVRAVVLRGAGGTFAAGTDIARFAPFRAADDGIRYERRIEEVVARLESVAVPTVAAVEGIAAGAGLVLAAACDLRVCTPNARFGAPIARTVGNALSLANTARLIAHLGPARVKRLLLLADFLGAAEAHAAGFVAAVVTPDDLDAHIDALCERLAAHAPLTIAVSKEAIRRITAAVPEDDDLMRRVYGSDDFREGVAAFLAKRPPRWTGR